MGLCLFFLPHFPAATFIQGAMFIPDSRVTCGLYKKKEHDSRKSFPTLCRVSIIGTGSIGILNINCSAVSHVCHL